MSGVEDHRVHEAVGPSLSGRETAGALGVGMNSLLVLGVLPVLLGALVDEHRLTDPDIGLVATVEVLTMGVATALAGILLKPRRLKLIGVAATLTLAAVDYATAGASGAGVFVMRGLAGAIEGVMLWITVAMIARTVTPERWAGVFFAGQTLASCCWRSPWRSGSCPAGARPAASSAIAACALAAAGAAVIGPSRLADLNPGEAIGGAPPLRGWIALVGTLIYVSGAGAVGVYLEPLALQAGLDPGVARTALWVSLAAQVAGSAAATMLAGRVRWFVVFMVTTSAYPRRLVGVRPACAGLALHRRQRRGGYLRAVSRPVPGADDHRGRSVAARCGAERRRPTDRRRDGAAAGLPRGGQRAACTARSGSAPC